MTLPRYIHKQGLFKNLLFKILSWYILRHLCWLEHLLLCAWNFKMIYRYKVKRKCFNTYAAGWREVESFREVQTWKFLIIHWLSPRHAWAADTNS